MLRKLGTRFGNQPTSPYITELIMSKKLFVGGLSWSIRDESLKEAFGVHGDVQEAIVILERGTNRSRGFGFVTFATEEEAQTALEFMNGTEIDGRAIHVSLAEERRERSSNNRNFRNNRGGGGGGGGNRDYNNNRNQDRY